ncbi:MAG: hypothetical protein AAF772_15265 [Acidobacteriota bacterium]
MTAADCEFEIQIMDDPDYEDLVAEIYFKGKYCFLLSQEAGHANLQIHIVAQDSGDPWCMSVDSMQSTIEEAKKRLWDLRRT